MIAFHFDRTKPDGTMFAVTDKGIWRSDDGQTWVEKTQGLPWKEIMVSGTGGKPFVTCRGIRYDGVSISHEKAYAVSVVII